MVFFNGKIYTPSGFEEAVRVDNGIISFIGNTVDVMELKEADEMAVDLKGRVMIPGFIDSHIHMLNYGFTCQMYNMYHLTSIEQMVEEARVFLQKNKLYQETWLLGRGWNQDYFSEARFPVKEDLDQISSELPIYFARTCGHMAVMNSKALEVLSEEGFDHEHMDWETGQVFEEAILEVFSHLPEPSLSGIKGMIIRAQEDMFAKGITSVHSDDLASLPKANMKTVIDAFNTLKEEGTLNIAVYEQCLLPTMKDLDAFEALGLKTGIGDEWFKIGPLKLLIDGSLGARTALMSAAYEGTDKLGIGLYTQERLNEMVTKAKAMGMQIACHGIGDGAMELILNSYSHINATVKDRHGIVHCQITNDKIFNSMKSMGVIGYIQPIFIDYDMHIVQERIGCQRMQTTYNWKRMMEIGIPLAGGSDAPVVGFDVFENLYSAITRKDLKGNPEGGWLPDQKLNRVEALELFTLGGAYAAFESDVKGSIEIGKQADLLVIDKDYFEVPEDEIMKINVDMTIAKGKIVYVKNQ